MPTIYQIEPYDNTRTLGAIMEAMQAPGRAQAAALRAQGENAATAGRTLATIAAGVPRQIQENRQVAQQSELQQLQLNAARQQEKDRAALDDAFANGLDREGILSRIPGHLRPGVQKQFADADEAALKVKKLKDDLAVSERDYLGSLAAGLKPHLTGDPTNDLQAAMVALQHAKEHGYNVDQLWGQVKANPAGLGKLVDSLIAASPKQVELQQAAARAVETTRHNKVGEEAAAATAAATTTDRQADNARADAAATEVQRHNRAMEARPVAGAVDSGDAEAIADAIINGEQPPEMTGLYRLAGPVKASLAKKGYDLTKATIDWKATTRHLQSMNSTQQLRLRQAAETAYHSLDVIDDLAKQWQGGKFPALNKVQLAAAKQGALGPQAQTIATQLEAQISDLTSELGNVYMGGNSPTDHALGLASKNLSANWSFATLQDMTKLARTNLRIRLNSMQSIGPAGVSTTPPAAPAPNTEPVKVTAPNGRSYTFPSQDAADNFKKAAGIK